MSTFHALLLLWVALAQQAQAPVMGWTQDEVTAAFERAGFSNIEETTMDPAFPSMNAAVDDGITVSVVRQVCGKQFPVNNDRCAVAAISFVLAATETRVAMAVLDAFEYSPVSTPGANLTVFDVVAEDSEAKSAVVISHYLASDGGVALGALDAQLEAMRMIAAEARGRQIEAQRAEVGFSSD